MKNYKILTYTNILKTYFFQGNIDYMKMLAILVCLFLTISNNVIAQTTTYVCTNHSDLVLGTYRTPPRLKNGRVNIKRLINELKDIHATNYGWNFPRVPKDSPVDNYDEWKDFKIFLKYAQKMGIKVWIDIYPPSFSTPSAPFGFNFELWASQIAALSVTYPCLVGWSIDDFSHNQDVFTPKRLKRILDAAHEINPTLKFVPCCYYREMTSKFVKNYKNLLDGILFPYRAASEKNMNLKDPNKVEYEISQLRSLFGVEFPIYLDIYATAHSKLGATTSEYVKEVLRMGRKVADGVIIYTLQDPKKHPEKYNIIKQGFQ